MTASTPAAAAASVLNNSGSGDVNDQVDLQASIARFLMLQQQRNQLHQQDQEEVDRKQPAIGHHHMQTSRPSPPASALTSMSASAPTLPPPALSALEACRRLGLSASQAPALAAAMAVAQGDNGNATHSRSTYAPQAATTNAPSTQLAALLQLARGTISNTSTAPGEPPEEEDQDSVEGAEKGKPRKGRAIKFPATLHSILCTIEQEGRGDVASFVPDGSGFIVHDPKAFVREYLSRHFKSSTFSSFQRQVNLYCFKRIKVGTDSIYKHPKFHRDHPGLVLEMTRTKIKNPKLAAAASARKMKRKQQQE
eukprot:Sro1357_g265760.2  (309) ;mRNA; r:12960-13886